MQINLQHEEQEFKPVVLKMIIESADELEFWKALCKIVTDESQYIRVGEELNIDNEIVRDCLEPLRATFLDNDVVKAEVVQNTFKVEPPCSCGNGLRHSQFHNPACSHYKAPDNIPAAYQCICGARNEVAHTQQCHYANQRRERGDDTVLGA